MGWLRKKVLALKKIVKRLKKTSNREVSRFKKYYKEDTDTSREVEKFKKYFNDDSSNTSTSTPLGSTISPDDVDAGAMPSNSDDSSGDSPELNATEANNAIEEGIYNAHFAEEYYITSSLMHRKIERGYIGDKEVFILVYAYNLAGKEATITIHEKEALLVAQDARRLDKGN